MTDQTDDWGQYLDAAVFATNTSTQSTTKVTPFRMMFSREPRFPLEAEKEGERASMEDIFESLQSADVEDVLEKLIQKQQEIFKAADERIVEAQKKQKEQYKKRKGVIDYQFKEGDKVLRRNMKQKTRKGSKHEDRWLGPYIIVELSKTTCRLTNALGKILKTRINLSQLKPYLSPLDQKHIESEDGLADQSGDDDELSGQDESTNPTEGTAEKEPSQPDEKTAETETGEATAETELPDSTAPDTKDKEMPPRKRPCSSASKRDAKKRRKNVTSNNSSNDPYDVETHISKQKVTRWWKRGLGLSVTDKKILDYHHKWLNDHLINAAQQMLQKQYGIAGLQDVTMLQTLSMDVQPGEFGTKNKSHHFSSQS